MQSTLSHRCGALPPVCRAARGHRGGFPALSSGATVPTQRTGLLARAPDHYRQVCCASATEGSVVVPPPSPPDDQIPGEGIAELKTQLLRVLASADRGIAADADQAAQVQQLATQLEAAGGPVRLSLEPGNALVDSSGSAQGLALLNGKWRLVYSSGFVDGSLGGQRPGPPAAITPFTLGQVYQQIAAYIGRLDNMVQLQFKVPLPLAGGPATVTVSLRHSFEIVGDSTVRITFEDTEVSATGGVGDFLDNVPTLLLPQLPEFLRPPADVRSAKFDVTYLDADMRITRGDRGELRVYLRP